MEKLALIEKLHMIERLVKECLAELGRQESSAPPKLKKDVRTRASSTIGSVDFGIPVRPFIKKYGKGLGGPKLFTLLVAYLSKGELNKEIKVSDIEISWNKMKSLAGMKFNSKYPVIAKDNDWVESKRQGIYCLRPLWKKIFSK